MRGEVERLVSAGCALHRCANRGGRDSLHGTGCVEREERDFEIGARHSEIFVTALSGHAPLSVIQSEGTKVCVAIQSHKNHHYICQTSVLLRRTAGWLLN